MTFERLDQSPRDKIRNLCWIFRLTAVRQMVAVRCRRWDQKISNRNRAGFFVGFLKYALKLIEILKDYWEKSRWNKIFPIFFILMQLRPWVRLYQNGYNGGFCMRTTPHEDTKYLKPFFKFGRLKLKILNPCSQHSWFFKRI